VKFDVMIVRSVNSSSSTSTHYSDAVQESASAAFNKLTQVKNYIPLVLKERFRRCLLRSCRANLQK